MKLRDYQREALHAISRRYHEGQWAQLVALPTGAGKTVMFARLPHILHHANLPVRMLVLAHREELLDQAARSIQRANPVMKVEIEQGERVADPSADVIVASIATLAHPSGTRLARLQTGGAWGAVVVDEAHHATATTYRRVLGALGLCAPANLVDGSSNNAKHQMQAWWRNHAGNCLLLGVTATPTRADGVGLEWVFESIVYRKTIREMVKAGYLVHPVGYLAQSDTDLDGVKTTAGDFNVRQLADAVNTPTRNALTVRTWERLAADRKTMVFTVNVDHAKALAECFRESGHRAGYASGEDRSAVEDFRRGDLQILTNCALLTEGFDDPAVSCLVHARPTKSSTLYTQMTGRALRLYEGKRDAVVIDVVDVARKHPLVTLSSLFGLPPGLTNLNGRSVVAVADALDAARQGLANTLDMSRNDDVSRYIQRINMWCGVQPSETAAQYSRLKWTDVTEGTFMIAIPKTRDVMQIQEDALGRWQVEHCAGITKTTVAETETITFAFMAADQYLNEVYPDSVHLMNLDAPWRRKPASEGQIAWLRRLRCPEDVLKGMTSGRASDIIDAAKQRKSA